jgi:hypothetical protein
MFKTTFERLEIEKWKGEWKEEMRRINGLGIVSKTGGK